MPDRDANDLAGVQTPQGLNFIVGVMRLRVEDAWPKLTPEQRIKATNCLDRMEADVEFFAEVAARTQTPDCP